MSLRGKFLYLILLLFLPLLLSVQAEGGIQTWEWKIKFDIVQIDEPTKVHARLDCTVSPDSGGAGLSKFSLSGLGNIENIMAYDPATKKPLKIEYSHPEGTVYFDETKVSPYTFTIECDVAGNLKSVSTGKDFHWDTSGWSEGSTAEIWFTLPRNVNEYSLDGIWDHDLIEEKGGLPTSGRMRGVSAGHFICLKTEWDPLSE